MPGDRRQYRDHTEEESGQDSFLDVVANVVGVLIILVMVVGLQASYGISVPESDSPRVPEEVRTTPSQPEVAHLRDDLKTLAGKVSDVQRRLQEKAIQLGAVRQETIAFDHERFVLARHRKVIEDDLSQRRAALDTKRQQDYDVQRQLFELQLDLEKMTQEHLTLLSATETTELECVPTPLARTIDGPALHLRLRHGLVSICGPCAGTYEDEVRLHLACPPLGEVFKGSRSWSMNTFGPVNGYRMHLNASSKATI